MSAGVTLGFRRGYWTAIGLQLGLALQIAIVAVGVAPYWRPRSWLHPDQVVRCGLSRLPGAPPVARGAHGSG